MHDPTDKKGAFGRLYKEIRHCKEAAFCPNLTGRSFYWEPNPCTIDRWHQDKMYVDGISRSVVFVCESPNRREETAPKRGWVGRGGNDKRFRDILKKHRLQDSYITNLVKCGSRIGKSRHSDDELKSCARFLIRELELLKPQIIVGVGANATSGLKKIYYPT